MAEVQPRTLRGALIRAHYPLEKEFDGTARDHGKTARKASEHAQPAPRIPRFSPPEPPSNPQHDWGIVHISRRGTWNTGLDRHTHSRIAPASSKEENGIAQEPDSIDHFALGVGPSLAVPPSVGLLLNYAPWGIRLSPVVTSPISLTVGLGVIARGRLSWVQFIQSGFPEVIAHWVAPNLREEDNLIILYYPDILDGLGDDPR